MENVKTQLAEKLKTSTNILVTVSSNPNVDQLTACLGMTLWLNKINKHATAVFSGDIPNALEFLQPEATIEKTTNSLRDFIIALDKSKADKLRYKVEDRVVKIFITPYRTNLSSDDLEFSQGDFNVDTIVAIGVDKQQDLDNAIISHGRILHDATVATINTTPDGGMGSINWHEPSSSSLSELVYELCQSLDATQLDPQIATALLTGIVAETNRFSNNKTTPRTMSVSAILMTAGANQQLVATKLEEAQLSLKPAPVAVPSLTSTASIASTANLEEQIEAIAKPNDGSLEIIHDKKEEPTDEQIKPYLDTADELAELATPVNEEVSLPAVQDQLDVSPISEVSESGLTSKQQYLNDAPLLGGTLTANSVSDDTLEPAVDPLNMAPINQNQLLNRKPLRPLTTEPASESAIPSSQSAVDKLYNDPLVFQTNDQQTLTEIEQSVASPHIDNLRNQVQDALKSSPIPDSPPSQALNAVNIELHDNSEAIPDNPLAFKPDMFEIEDEENSHQGPNDPPQVPPPIVPPNFLPPSPPQ